MACVKPSRPYIELNVVARCFQVADFADHDHVGVLAQE